jgi:hypothetical protein
MKVIERKIYESYCITLVRKDAKEEALKNTSNLITSVKNPSSGTLCSSTWKDQS